MLELWLKRSNPGLLSVLSTVWPREEAPDRLLLCGGARGAIVTVVGNGHDDTSSNPGRG